MRLTGPVTSVRILPSPCGSSQAGVIEKARLVADSKKKTELHTMIADSVTSQKNILLVDDDSIANFLIERIVQSTGLARHIEKALNGREALKVFTDHNSSSLPEVVLLDLNMPIMNGFEFLQAYNNLQFEEKDNVLIILVTSSNNPSDIERARELGIKYYLTKPISADTIKGIIMKEFE
jgi:CheY-like chemotaxis protein